MLYGTPHAEYFVLSVSDLVDQNQQHGNCVVCSLFDNQLLMYLCCLNHAATSATVRLMMGAVWSHSASIPSMVWISRLVHSAAFQPASLIDMFLGPKFSGPGDVTMFRI